MPVECLLNSASVEGFYRPARFAHQQNTASTYIGTSKAIGLLALHPPNQLARDQNIQHAVYAIRRDRFAKLFAEPRCDFVSAERPKGANKLIKYGLAKRGQGCAMSRKLLHDPCPLTAPPVVQRIG